MNTYQKINETMKIFVFKEVFVLKMISLQTTLQKHSRRECMQGVTISFGSLAQKLRIGLMITRFSVINIFSDIYTHIYTFSEGDK